MSFDASSGLLTQTSAVPEPQTWALMLLGLLALGQASRSTSTSRQRF